jgi:transcriptional regulator NrdR family protein
LPTSPKGLHCPSCHGVRLTVICTKKPCPGVRVRYRKCTACGQKVTTKEIIIRVSKSKS